MKPFTARVPGPCTVRQLNILHFLFYIQKQEKPSHTLIFLFLFKNLSMQNLNLCKTHRFTELLVIRSPMPIYIRKKNVEIFKLYQNCRNDVQFNSNLRKKKKRKLPTSVFRYSFYLQKNTKKTKNENRLQFFVLFTVQTNCSFSFSVTVYEVAGGRGRWGGGGEWLEPNHRGWLEDTALCSLRREAPLRGAPAP